jgi:hypothetical protein
LLTYDGTPTYTVSIMQFSGDHVTRETQYFADPFDPPAWQSGGPSGISQQRAARDEQLAPRSSQPPG